MSAEAWSAEAFEHRYQQQPDPWDFRTSPYEQGRYRAIVDALDRPRYRFAYEPACSVGELTCRLARVCDRVRAVDVSPTAVAAACERCADLPGVEVEVASVADDDIPPVDLVVFSELGYYFDEGELDVTIDRLVSSMEPGGCLVACHWLGHSEDHRLHGTTVHQHLSGHPTLLPRLHQDHEGFVLDTWMRR